VDRKLTFEERKRVLRTFEQRPVPANMSSGRTR
jgi:hypothetical protein